MQQQPIGVIYANVNLGSGARFYAFFVYVLKAGKNYTIDGTSDGSTYANPYQVAGSGQAHTVTVDVRNGTFPRVVENP